MPPFWTIGTLFGASSVMLGAFGAHGLKKRIADPARIANWGTAAQYQKKTKGGLRIGGLVLGLDRWVELRTLGKGGWTRSIDG
ncbi:hypothetical protein HBI85_200750 [Parastagonospora nodorum]|nr:hypothetical protein HBI85_200750 [Parastagonospora nodorum]